MALIAVSTNAIHFDPSVMAAAVAAALGGIVAVAWQVSGFKRTNTPLIIAGGTLSHKHVVNQP